MNNKHLHTNSQSRRSSDTVINEETWTVQEDEKQLRWRSRHVRRTSVRRSKLTISMKIRTPPPCKSKIKQTDKNKCSFSSSLFCSRLRMFCPIGNASAAMKKMNTNTRIKTTTGRSRCKRTHLYQ